MSPATSSVPLRQYSVSESQSGDIAADLLEAAAQASAAQDSSAESADEANEASPDGGAKTEKRKKRSRACQACRNMKIRCNPVEGQEACLACSKVNRECVMPGPARKRQKTVHKVAELEKKINALTQSLLAKTQQNPTPQQSPAITDASRSAKEAPNDSPQEQSNFPLFPKHETPRAAARVQVIDASYQDVIDRGVLSASNAETIFDHFMSEMNPLCPLIALPNGTTFESIRRSRPMLSLAILSAGCVRLLPDIHTDIATELAGQFANRVFFVFERSLDLIQALLLHTTWIGKHKEAKDIGFNQYIHSAIVMAHDLGLSKKLTTPLTKDPVEEAELRRTWLACYWCGTCVATTLRHPPMVKSTPYLKECLEFLAKPVNALPTDAALCCLVKAVAIMEDVLITFHMDEPSHTVRIEDASTQYSIKLFERRLDEWREQSRKLTTPSGYVDLIYHTASLYIHEVSLWWQHNVDDFRPPSERHGTLDELNYPENFITPSHLDALTRCVVAMKGALEGFVTIFPSERVRHLPCLSMVWTAYAAVAMIRLDGALRASKSQYADVFLPDLKVEYYLDAIVERLSGGVSAAGLTCGPVPLFIQAFQKLKKWHQYRLAGHPVPAETADLANPQQGMQKVHEKILKFTEDKECAEQSSPVTSGTTPGSRTNFMSGQFGDKGLAAQQQPNMMHTGPMGGLQDGQGFDGLGGSWLTNSNVPIDASMFESQDWNFTLQDWTNFETSMVQPAGGSTWLGYLL